MKKLFALFLCLSIMLLSACGNSADESKAETTTTEAAVVTESHTTELYSGVTTIYERPLRMRGDYDSVPTVIQPKPLSEKELKSISIPTSPNDPYSYVISDLLEWYKQAGSRFNSENERYSLYDINDDGTDELILGDIGVLGGTSVYEEHEGVSAEYTFGLLISEVYTIQNGKAVRVQHSAVSADAYETVIFDNGILKVVRLTPRNPRITYRKMVNGVFEMVGDCIYKTFDGKFYYLNGNDTGEITEEEFNRRIAEIEDGAHPVELEWKHLQDYGK